MNPRADLHSIAKRNSPISLFSRRIETKFSGHPFCTLVTILTQLSGSHAKHIIRLNLFEGPKSLTDRTLFFWGGGVALYIYIFFYLFIDNMFHYNVILHVPVLHLVLSYIFLFGMCVALKQKGSAHITVILTKSERILYWSRSVVENL